MARWAYRLHCFRDQFPPRLARTLLVVRARHVGETDVAVQSQLALRQHCRKRCRLMMLACHLQIRRQLRCQQNLKRPSSSQVYVQHPTFLSLLISQRRRRGYHADSLPARGVAGVICGRAQVGSWGHSSLLQQCHLPPNWHQAGDCCQLRPQPLPLPLAVALAVPETFAPCRAARRCSTSCQY